MTKKKKKKLLNKLRHAVGEEYDEVGTTGNRSMRRRKRKTIVRRRVLEAKLRGDDRIEDGMTGTSQPADKLSRCGRWLNGCSSRSHLATLDLVKRVKCRHHLVWAGRKIPLHRSTSRARDWDARHPQSTYFVDYNFFVHERSQQLSHEDADGRWFFWKLRKVLQIF